MRTNCANGEFLGRSSDGTEWVCVAGEIAVVDDDACTDAFVSGVFGVVFAVLFACVIGMALRLAYKSGVMKGEHNEREKRR